VGGVAVTHDEPPPPEIRHVEFAEDFHGLFHPVWSRQCDNRRLHLSRAWEYRWRPELHRVTLCRLGRHRVIKSWRRDADPATFQPTGPWRFQWTCYYCGYAPPLTKL
jgi:hypothetical protein